MAARDQKRRRPANDAPTGPSASPKGESIAPGDLRALERICSEALLAVGYDLVDLEYLRDQQGWVLRVFIDHPMSTADAALKPSGIRHADCEQASRHLGAVLDVENVLHTAYRLEVSSPGIPRRLKRAQDFARFVGRRVKVVTGEMVEGRRNFAGTLRGCDGAQVTLDVDGASFVLPLTTIRKALLDEELS